MRVFFAKFTKKKQKSVASFLQSSASSSKSNQLSLRQSTSEDGSFLSSRFDSKLKVTHLYDHPLKKCEMSSTSVSLRQTSFDKSLMNLNGQLNQNLKFLDEKLTNLQWMANDIGIELRKQNSKLDTTVDVAMCSQNKVASANEMGKRLLKKEAKSGVVPLSNAIRIKSD